MPPHEERLYRASPSRRGPSDRNPTLREPLRLYEGVVRPEWIDYNDHMTESRYLQVFGDASDALTAYLGVDAAYRAAEGSYHTAETHI